MNLNIFSERMEKVDYVLNKNTKVSTKACEGIRKSNGKLKKAIRKNTLDKPK